jgi:ribosome biogenesis protein SSF1/2
MPKRGRSRKKNRTHVEDGNDAGVGSGGHTTSGAAAASIKVPKSLIVRRGKTASEIGELVIDLRRVMMPYTAMNFQDTGNNDSNRKITLQQYCTAIALPMGITHILQISQKEERCNLRIARMPEGPTLYFRIHAFSLIRHIQSIQRRPVAINSNSFVTQPPITVTNNFGDHTALPHIKLLRITFQNLFPQINVSTVKLKDCRRVVLFNLMERSSSDSDSTEDKNRRHGATSKEPEPPMQVVEMRHYAVKATPVGVDRKVRRLIQSKLPNLHNVNDIADYITNQSTSSTRAIRRVGSTGTNDVVSDSEPEDDPEHIIQLSDQYVGAGCNAKQKSALKLVEIGPRLSIQLIKVEKGLDSNRTPCLYNLYVTKTKEEIEQIQSQKDQEYATKQERRSVQEKNVELKRVAVEEKRELKRMKIQQKQQEFNTQLQDDLKIEGVSSSDDDDDDDVDDDDGNDSR